MESRGSAGSWMLGDAVKQRVVSGEKDCVLSSGKYFYDLKESCANPKATLPTGELLSDVVPNPRAEQGGSCVVGDGEQLLLAGQHFVFEAPEEGSR